MTVLSVTVVIPIYNEEENIRRLYDALIGTMSHCGREFELIFVDDGSSDSSSDELERLMMEDPVVRVIEFRQNFGQTAAMSAGIREATKDVIVTIDGDLQNDPSDIPMMLEKIEEGYDLVHGWRKNRQDKFLTRKLPSKIANALISKVTGFPVRDLGCTLKAMRREVGQELRLYGEMHRFIPILAHWRGAKCVEVVTKHHPRKFGQSKYGLSRTIRVILDLITVKYLIQYLVSPMKLFGAIGLLCCSAGLVSGVVTVWMKVFQHVDMTGNPLLLLTVGSTVVGFQFIGMGMLGELGARIYYEVEKFPPYAIRKKKNFQPINGEEWQEPVLRKWAA